MKMDRRLYAMLNKKIKNSGGSSGGTSVYVQNCTINDAGYLIVTLSDGSTLNAGYCVGPQGEIGPQGPIGETGPAGADGQNGTNGTNGQDGIDGISPTIEVYSNTSASYQLKINNADGTSIITPNLLGSGASTTRYYIFDNALYLSYTDTIYTIFNGQMKSLQEYIDADASFCSAEYNHALYYNTSDFGWNGQATSFNTISITIDPSQYILFGYMSNSMKSGEYFKLIPAGLVSGSTNLEKAQSIKSLLETNDVNIVTIDFEYVYATNGVTEAVDLSTVAAGEYYIAWTGTSDNSTPKVNDVTIM